MLKRQVANLPEDSVIYYLIVLQDGDGQNVNPLAYLESIAGVANRPIYSWTESTLNRGVVGGSLRSQRAQIDALAGLTTRILQGEFADTIPLTTPALNKNQVDWRQLDRWDIDEARVPADTSILFRERSFLQQ